MTTEQMDEKDDARTGRGRWPFTPNPADGVRLNPDEPAPDLDPEQHFGHEPEMHIDEVDGIRAWGMSGIPEIMFGDPSDEQLAAAQKRSGRNGVLIIPEKFKEYLEPFWVEREASEVQSPPNFEEAEEHTHHTREARDQCAAGDHQYAVLLDDAAEREKRAADDWEIRSETTMAEEPIEHRLRRAWLNGYTDGFSEGFNRAAYQTNWER